MTQAGKEPWKRSAQYADQKRQERTALRRQVDDGREDEDEESGEIWLGHRDPRISQSEWTARRNELRFLKDPLEVANFVRKELQKDKVNEMVQLVRMASHSMKVVVSWNHIVDYYMAHERISEALKLYNEVRIDLRMPIPLLMMMDR